MNALTLPDIAAQSARLALPLDWVGMRGIALPVVLEGQCLSARVDAGVSLDDGEARGIHMSRLYLALETLEQRSLSPALLHQVLKCFLTSHQGLSACAYLNIHTVAETTRVGQPLGRLEILSGVHFSEPETANVPRGTKN